MTPTRSSRTRTGHVPRHSVWQELRLVAQERLIEAELACGRAAAMIPEIESLTREHSLREAFRAQLMIALYRAGRHAEALAVFRDYRTLLVDELGVEPSPTLAALEQRVLSHDPGLVLSEPAGRPLRGYRLGRAAGHRPQTAPCTPRASPASSATSRSGSSGRRSPTAPSSCGRSRPAPSSLPRSGTRGSCRSTTTGANREPPTS